MVTTRQRLGKLGEDVAARYLERRGWTILGRNVRTRAGEIDVLASDGETLVFLEVRTRSGRDFGTPEESITPAKRDRLERCALTYLAAHAEPNEPDLDWRIDLIAIELSRGRISHLEHYEHVLQ
jgi:putative endonuclease